MYRYDAADLTRCVEVLRAFGASKVWLFGGGLAADRPAGDLDLACEGVPDRQFYRAAGQLLDVLGRPVDLVDVSEDNRLSRHIRSTGRLIYDAG